jgi:thiol-disulfide isomerase/thioredoxin
MEPEAKTNFVMNHIMSNKLIYISLIIFVIIGVVGYIFVYPKLKERFINKKTELVVDEILEDFEQITPGKISLVVCYAAWCGYTKRFMGMSQPDEREYQFTYQNSAIFKNEKDGKKVSDWEVLKNAFTGTNVNIVEIDFEEPSSHSKEQIAYSMDSKVMMSNLKDSLLFILKIGDTYTRFSESRRADEIAKWMDRITGADHKHETILRDSLRKEWI